MYRCSNRCALDVYGLVDNHNLHCCCCSRNNDDGCGMWKLMTADFRTCKLNCLSRTLKGQHNRASSQRCKLSEISFLNRMANDDGSWRTRSTRWYYLVEFLTMRRSLRSLERRTMLLKPMLYWVLLGYCYLSLSDWKCLDLSMNWPPTVLEPFQLMEQEYFGNSVVHRHLQAEKKKRLALKPGNNFSHGIISGCSLRQHNLHN